MTAQIMDTIRISQYRLPVSINIVDVDRSGQWLTKGWQDVWKAPGLSLTCGICFVIVSYALTWGLIDAGFGSMVLPAAGGFMLISPLLAVGFYAVSRMLEKGEKPGFIRMWVECGNNIGQVMAMGVVLLVFWMAWVLLAILTFTVFFGTTPPPLEHFFEDVIFAPMGVPFLAVGTMLGGLLAMAIFGITAVSIPLLQHKQVDVVTAIIVSILAVNANKKVMIGWAAMIAVIMGVGIATFYVGLAIAFPLIGYATWHCYRDLINHDV